MRKGREHSKPLSVRAAEAPGPPPRACVEVLSAKKRLKVLDILRAKALALEDAREDAQHVREGITLAIQMVEMAIPWLER